MISYIRSLAFNVSFFTWTFLVCAMFYPLLFTKMDLAFVGRVWASGSAALLRIFCNITFEVIGKENIKEPCIIAAKHQSAWETIMFHIIFPSPIYVLKKELYQIPLYGHFLQRMNMIGVDRSAGIKALKEMHKGVRAAVEKGRVVAIYPEGTRTAYQTPAIIQPGIISIYQGNIAPIIPVSLNSGKFWGKNSFIKKPGVITVKINKAISENLDKKDFTKILAEKIDELNI